MRLICEQLEDVEFICEASEKGKNYFIEGVFMQANVKNRNGRLYPKHILTKEAKRYEQINILCYPVDYLLGNFT